ncbi:MAG: enoyl-CoA hydratase/isomerase family protein [Caulobacteraceae bacterium]
MAENEVLAWVEGGVGRLRLNRPKALNALTTTMCRLITEALLEWQDDDGVRAVLIDHAGERGFCAGGDIKLIQESGQGDGKAAREFFATEYRMNELLFRYPKPTVAVMDGIVMGGGVGVSMPCRYRVATERTLWAMPEADIGLYPDVGAGWYLARLPQGAGAWLALTAARLRAGDCLHLGIATHYLDSGHAEAAKAALISAVNRAAMDADDALTGALAEYPDHPPFPVITDHWSAITSLFDHETAEEIVAALEADGSEWALAQRDILLKKCPTTHKVSLRLIAAGAKRLTFADELAAEYRASCRMVHRHDFIEGVRALIIDKDGAPVWSPATLGEVTEDMLDAIFAELPSDEEWTAHPA